MIDYYPNYVLFDCSSSCKDNYECTWFTYDTQGEICYIWKDCIEHNDNKRYISGEKDCKYINGNSNILLD